MRYLVTFELDINKTHTREELIEWLEFELGINNIMESQNPLNKGIEAVRGSLKVSEKYQGRREIYG